MSDGDRRDSPEDDAELVREADARSDVPKRRYRLRALDVALGEELEDAGALTFRELRDHVADRDLLGCPVTDDTLWEWWHYALRRQLLEPRDPRAVQRFGLTAEGRAQIVRRRASESGLVTPAFVRTGRLAMAREQPITLAIALVALVSANPSTRSLLVLAVTILFLAVVLGPLVDVLVARRLDRTTSRRALSRHVAWLDGAAVPRWLWLPGLRACDPSLVRRLPAPPLQLRSGEGSH
ncbi:hypothetical protein SK069_00940 [Patulibacter brassicae]|uniref:TIGR04222 domain-containing membrane protein n=1 Tax=Patulibacter brassicae TaxID=1705717 RepID=A0ABU4VEE0_9ACTN|nr:hypothetical protein [Patulibacter brassicae]MDX8150145.1 hypothetical protein [Patulibacter brassicae]